MLKSAIVFCDYILKLQFSCGDHLVRNLPPNDCTKVSMYECRCTGVLISNAGSELVALGIRMDRFGS